MKFHLLESEDGTGCRRITHKGNPVLEGSSRLTTIGGSGLSNTAAADLIFAALCVLIFAGTPLVMVLR